MGSPGKVTKEEFMEILFGYLMFTGLDRLMSSMSGAIFGVKSDDEKAEKAKHFMQLLAIVIAVGILFWYKFKT